MTCVANRGAFTSECWLKKYLDSRKKTKIYLWNRKQEILGSFMGKDFFLAWPNMEKKLTNGLWKSWGIVFFSKNSLQWIPSSYLSSERHYQWKKNTFTCSLVFCNYRQRKRHVRWTNLKWVTRKQGELHENAKDTKSAVSVYLNTSYGRGLQLRTEQKICERRIILGLTLVLGP